jgi:hypothetical protein
MPWLPEHFSGPALERIEADVRGGPVGVPYFAGVMAGDTDALVRSFSTEPELHDPIRGRVRGAAALERFVRDTNRWLTARNVSVTDVDRIITPLRTVEEVVVRLDQHEGPVELPVAIVADRSRDGHLTELRVYFSTWPLRGTHAIRPPLLQPDPVVSESDVVGVYQRALAAGDVEGALALFEPEAYVREPAGGPWVHSGHDELRTLFEYIFSNGGGIPWEHCSATDDGRGCALEYNLVQWGVTELPPQAAIAVHGRGASGRLAAVRIYEDTDPPLPGPPRAHPASPRSG